MEGSPFRAADFPRIMCNVRKKPYGWKESKRNDSQTGSACWVARALVALFERCAVDLRGIARVVLQKSVRYTQRLNWQIFALSRRRRRCRVFILSDVIIGAE